MSLAAHSDRTIEDELRRLRTLYRLLSILSHAESLGEVYGAVIDSLLEATGADRAAILMFDPDGVMRFKAWRDLSKPYREAAASHSPWPRGTRNAAPVAVPDVLLDESLATYGDLLVAENIRAVVFVPLELDRGVFGKFMLYYREVHEAALEELEVARAIATHVALAVRQREIETAHAASERRLQAASLLLASVVESSNDAIITKDLNGIITSWNRAAERMFGYTAAEAVGQPIAMLAAERLDEMPDILTRLRRGERFASYETRRRRKDGRIIDVSLTVSPVREPGGNIIGASKIARDISGRKTADAERASLLSREQEARETAELLNHVARRLAVELDPQKLVQLVTDTAIALVGAEVGSFVHNVANEKSAPGAFAGFPMPESGDRVIRCDDSTAQDRPDAYPPVRSYLAVPVISRSGEVIGGLCLGHSQPRKFTESHEAILAGLAAQAAIAMDNARLFEQSQWGQRELKRSNEELRRANQDLEAFAYSASHDLQEPLRTVSLSAQLLERNLKDRVLGEDAIFLNRILSGSARMHDLIQDLLAYTQATKYAGGPPPSVDSAEVLGRVLDALRAQMQEAEAVVTFSALPVIRMHDSRLAQVFQNLVSNAIKYRNRQQPPRVHISAEESNGWFIFAVRDNGIGIEPRYAEQIFGLFKRLHTREEYPGSGVGLSICQRIVDQYGGRIWLEKSAPGNGSTFCFSVPARS